MLDIDSIVLPKQLRTAPYTNDHALWAIAQLPLEFQGVDCVWQASASAGVDHKILKLHLWFLLSQPLTAAQLRQWLRGTPNLDPSTLRAVQPHYTAAPIGGETVYSGARLGLVRGALRKVRVPELAEHREYASTTEMTQRPERAANVSRETIVRANKLAHTRAHEELNECVVAYQTAYRIGAILGPAVALETWNDVAEGHETWKPYAETSAAEWGELVAGVPGATHSAEFYAGRVMQGIEWGVARERDRRAAQSQAALDAAIRSTSAVRQSLLNKMRANVGSEQVLKEVGKELGRYAAHVDRKMLVDSLQLASGFSEQQVNDALAAGEVDEIDASEWREGLTMTGRHADIVEASDSNILRIYKRYPNFLSGFRFNVRTKFLEAREDNVLELPVGRVDMESLPARLAEWLCSIDCNKASANTALTLFRMVIADTEQYDPFLEAYPEALLSHKEAKKALEKLEERKLDTWLIDHFGCRDKPYVRLVGAKTLIAAVARAVKPGAQVDTMLILQGQQGIGKTKVLRRLGGVVEHGYQELLDMRDKDSLIAMNDGLIVEVSELKALRYAQEETAKAFFSRQRDRLRAPYARQAQDYDRRIVFIGTTNDYEFLSEIQNRRYWPVACREVCKLTASDADVLWREAALRYAAGEQWWLEGDEQKLQEASVSRFRSADVLEDALRPWLVGKTRITLLDACRVVHPDAPLAHVKDRRIAQALRALGWESRKKERERYWVASSV